MSTIRGSIRTRLVGAALVVCALAWATPLQAAPAPASRHNVVDYVVKGKIFKPQVFIYLGKPELDLSWSLDDARFKRSFLERTLDSVWSRPL